VAVLPVGEPFIVVLSVVDVVDELLSPQAERTAARANEGIILMIVFMIKKFYPLG
jgi:hypothetical protein